jgi:hypothetical protein
MEGFMTFKANRKRITRWIAPALLAGICLIASAPNSILATDPPKPPTKTEINEDYALKFHQENLPEIYSTIIIVRSKDPGAYRKQFYDHMMSETRRLVNLRDRGSKLYGPSVKEARASFQSTELAKQLREPDKLAPDELLKKSEELPKVLSELFDARAEIRKIQIEKMREDIDRLISENDKMKKDLADLEAKKNEIIEKQLNDVLRPKPSK